MTAAHIRYYFIGTAQEFRERYRYIQVEPHQTMHVTEPGRLAGRVINPWDQVEFGESFSRWNGDRRQAMWETIIACQIAGRRVDAT